MKATNTKRATHCALGTQAIMSWCPDAMCLLNLPMKSAIGFVATEVQAGM